MVCWMLSKREIKRSFGTRMKRRYSYSGVESHSDDKKFLVLLLVMTLTVE